MATIVLFNGVDYSVPAYGDTGWAQGSGNLSQYLIALASGTFQQTGGNFTLTADANFGATYGLVSVYFKSFSSNIASTGVVRLANTDTIDWRNFANTADLPLGVNTSNQLTFNGVPVASPTAGVITTGTQYQLAYYATSGTVLSGNPNTMAATEALVTDANGVPTTTGNGGTTATEIGYVHGVTSSIQTQINDISGGGSATVWGPIGSSFLYSSATPPNANYVVKNGQAISRTTYSALFALIGTTFGPGDGSTTFNIPNATNNFPIGAGGLYALGATGGSTTHTLTNAEVPSGTYNAVSNSTSGSSVTDGGHVHGERTFSNGAGANNVVANTPNIDITGGTTSNATPTTQSATTGITVATTTTTTTTVSDTNGGGAHSILNPYLAEYWMYRVQ
jgi:microcystin-dependent protein